MWTSQNQDIDGTGVFSQRFDSNGAKTGDEMRVNTWQTGNQYDPGNSLKMVVI